MIFCKVEKILEWCTALWTYEREDTPDEELMWIYVRHRDRKPKTCTHIIQDAKSTRHFANCEPPEIVERLNHFAQSDTPKR